MDFGVTMTILYTEGRQDVDNFKTVCRSNGLDPKKVIFVFPGNPSHHGPHVTPYTIKSGGGLAAVAQALGQAGYPTLSLPTTGMEHSSNDPNIEEIGKKAVDDLFKAVGEGFHIMIPVRKRTEFFPRGLIAFNGKREPSFWGAINKQANIPLAEYYLQQLELLAALIDANDEEKEAICAANHGNRHYQAYINAKASTNRKSRRKSTTNLKPLGQEHKDERIQNEPKTIKPSLTHVERQSMGKEDKTLHQALDLLNDYTQFNSGFLRFFRGYWNRHHVKEVHEIVQRVINQQINTTSELLEELEKIRLVNKNGSLANHITTIRDMLNHQQGISLK